MHNGGVLQPEDLDRLFLERANAGDVDGVVALYEDRCRCGGSICPLCVNSLSIAATPTSSGNRS